jgi:hypothetical protein
MDYYYRARLALLVAAAAMSAGAMLAQAAQAEPLFTVPQYAFLAGGSSAPAFVNAGGVEKECGKLTFTGRQRHTTSASIEFEPIYDECVAKELSGLFARMVVGRCDYRLHGLRQIGGEERWHALLDIACKPGYTWDWNVYEDEGGFKEGHAACATSMPFQKNLQGVELVALHGGRPGRLAIHWNVHGIAYRSFGFPLLCGSTFGVLEHDAAIEGDSVLTASNVRERPIGLVVREEEG